MGGEGHDYIMNARLRMKIKLSNWFSAECKFLWWYGGNNNSLSVWEKVEWMICRACNTQIFWLSTIKNQRLLAVLSLSILWGRMERFKLCHSSQDSLAPWSLDVNLTGKMFEVGKIFFGVDGWGGCTQKERDEKILRYRRRKCWWGL